MKGLFFLIAGILLISPAQAETLKKMRNQYTGKPDYYTKLSSSTMPSGSTQYAQINPGSQQSGTVNLSSGSFAVIFVGMKTLAQLTTLTPQTTSQMYFCQDCATDALCISTGLVAPAFVAVSSRTVRCR